MTSCRDLLEGISTALGLGFKVKNTNDVQVNPATEDNQLLKYPNTYYSEKITNASTSNTTITPGFGIIKTTIINNGTKEIIVSIGVATGETGTDISIPAGFNLSIKHDAVSSINYKGADSGGAFVLLVQGRNEGE